MQIFTYMDTDNDSQLKYRDFCNLFAEQALVAPSDASFYSSGKASGSDFSKIIKSLKAKNPSAKGRGGPNFVNKRGQSAGRQQENNFVGTKNISEMIGDQPFVSSELQRFMHNKRDLPLGHSVHSPMHNRIDSIRDEGVYNCVNGSRPPSTPNQWSTSSPGGTASNFSKLKSRL